MLQTTARAFARRSLESLQQQVSIRTRVYTTATTRVEPVAVAPPSTAAIEHLVFQRRVAMVILTLLAALFVMRRAGRQRERLVAQQVAELLDQSGVTATASEAGSRDATSRGIP
jgi:cell division inhibitor SulA